MRINVCSVCDHPERAKIEELLSANHPIKTLAKRYELPVSSVRAHRDADHKTKRPIPKPTDPPVDEEKPERIKPDPREPFPSFEEIATIRDKRARGELMFRYLSERRYKGPRTIALLARLWRKDLGNEAELRIADMFADAALRHARLRGPRHLRREEMLIEARDLYKLAKGDKKYDSALNTLKFIAEIDGLTYEPGMLSALVEAQAWRQIRPLIEKEAPHLIAKIDRQLAGADRKRSKAIRTLEEGPEPGEHEEPPMLGPATGEEASRQIDLTTEGGEAAGEGSAEE